MFDNEKFDKEFDRDWKRIKKSARFYSIFAFLVIMTILGCLIAITISLVRFFS